MNANGETAIGYRRLSERDQSRYSLEYQDNAINEYCTRNSLTLIGSYTDNGQSSYTFDRPDYKAIEAFIKKHKGKARYLIIMDHTRFSRNLSEALAKITELEYRYGIKVLACHEPLDIDPEDPYVFMQRSMHYMYANTELLLIRKRTRDGIRQAQTSGRFVHIAPFGYINKRDEQGKGAIVVDDEKAVVIQKIFRDYLNGVRPYQIMETVKPQGFNHTNNGAIVRTLSNPVYAGFVKVGANRKQPERLVKGLHPPLISEADYWLVQEKLGNKRPSKAQPKEDFPLRGILKCTCGKSMTAGFSKGKNKYYLYYRCMEHTQTNIPGTMLHEKFEELLGTLSFSDTQVQHILAQATTLLKDATKENGQIREAREKQLQAVIIKIDKLEERLMNDEIDAETYKKWRNKFMQERALLTDELQSAKKNEQGNKLEELKTLLPQLTSLQNIYRIATLPRKQLLIRGVFKHTLTYSDGAFRTPSINPVFAHNSLKAKEKGLLLVDEQSSVWEKLPCGSPDGNRTHI